MNFGANVKFRYVIGATFLALTAGTALADLPTSAEWLVEADSDFLQVHN
jgi:hypothetical protein